MLEPECGWITSDPDACSDCPLNPDHIEEPEPVEVSPWTRHILHLDTLQSAGAVFNYEVLSPREWRGLLMVKAERNKHMTKNLSKK